MIWLFLAGPWLVPVVIWAMAEQDGELTGWVWGGISLALTGACFMTFGAGWLRIVVPLVVSYAAMFVWKMTHPPKGGKVTR